MTVRPSGQSTPRPVPVPGTTDSPVPPDDVVAYTRPRDGLPPVTDSPAALRSASAALAKGAGPVAVDAERASGFRYGQDAYLIQLRRAGSGTLLIDPVTAGPLDALAQVLDGPEWILHAADQDLPCLHELGLRPRSLFDTELAARLLGRTHVGLGAVTEETLGLRLAKDHAAADWSVRPLPDSWLIYAALDVELLAELRDALSTELRVAGKAQWAAQEFEYERTRPPRPTRVDPWRRTPHAGRAVRTPRSLAVLRELWIAREKLAAELDRTPSRVLSHQALIAAAITRPTSRRKLVAIKEFSSRQTRQHQEVWWEAVDRAMHLPESDLPPVHAPLPDGELPQPRSWGRHHPEAARALEVVRLTVRSRADELRLPQELLLSPDSQRHLAWDLGRAREAGAPADTSTPAVAARLTELEARPWQVEQVGPALSEALTTALA
ncbi:HRDC domain-containing protein [Actinomyces sp. oral taxon 448]|uniref:HRDC domain-containing protein n=1 Tax=Actinomyces sp. oral taxon 448 TaxID=712124 RepID=UPI00021888DB|nr:HRDC domain-containing protein [Actinomyces sp. oral taxon 448]EGQ73750.1 ribonuclease D [Actinomyces sp. oral taxon 448 str. F0400]